MAAEQSFRLAVLFLLLSGAVSDSIGNASDVSEDTPSTGTIRITNSLDNKVTPTITATRQGSETFTSTMMLPNTTTDSSNALSTNEVIYAITTDMLPALPSTSLRLLMTTSGLQTTVSPSSVTMTPLASTSFPLSILSTSGFQTIVSPSSTIVSPSSVTMTPLPTLTQPSVPPTHELPSSSIFTLTLPTMMFPPSVTSMPAMSTLPSAIPTNMSSLSVMFTSSNATLSPTLLTTSVGSSPTATPTGKSKAEENRKLLLYIGPPAGLLVLICIVIGTILCIRRYRRIRKWRLQLMPLHNLDNADSDEEELLNDDQAPTFQVSDEVRRPILTFDE